ncbi:MAG: PIG-L family deacetylase [Anaerolineales bacterium]|nr:PIG-L family deacetylase [Anaerolineales bacterium]
MMRTSFDKGTPKEILCLGAHCDDIEIGCGGSILKYARECDGLGVHWVVFSSDDRREKEALRSANEFLKDVRRKNVEIHRFRNSYFPYQGAQIKEYFEKLKDEISPDMIFTHYRNDLHQDHRVINELTWNTFRDHVILEYEILKYDGDLGSPNAFVYLDESICRTKTKNIIDIFVSQGDKKWFTEDAFMSLLRIRGVESSAPDKYAEGFYCRKMII